MRFACSVDPARTGGATCIANMAKAHAPQVACRAMPLRRARIFDRCFMAPVHSQMPKREADYTGIKMQKPTSQDTDNVVVSGHFPTLSVHACRPPHCWCRRYAPKCESVHGGART